MSEYNRKRLARFAANEELTPDNVGGFCCTLSQLHIFVLLRCAPYSPACLLFGLCSIFSFLSSPSTSLSFLQLRYVSIAAASMSEWLNALHQYGQVCGVFGSCEGGVSCFAPLEDPYGTYYTSLSLDIWMPDR